MTRAREAETKFIREQNELEITKAKEMSGIETEKFKNMVDSIGSDTIASIANAGPEMQVGGVKRSIKMLLLLGISYDVESNMGEFIETHNCFVTVCCGCGN